MNHRLKGLICTLFSAILFGLCPVFCKFSYEEGGTPLSVTFFRAFVAIPFLFGTIHFRRMPFRLKFIELRDMLLAGAVGMTATALLLSGSYAYIGSGLATTLHFTYPALTSLCGSLFFRERLNSTIRVALLLVTAGVVCFSWNTASVEPLGVSLALLSGMTYTFYILFLDHSSLQGMDTCRLLFYFSIVMGVIVGAYGLLTDGFSLKMTMAGYLFTFINSLCALLAGLLFQTGVRLAGGAIAAMASALEPATSILFGIIFFHEPMRLPEILGSIAVMVGILLLISPHPHSTSAESASSDAPTNHYQ